MNGDGDGDGKSTLEVDLEGSKPLLTGSFLGGKWLERIAGESKTLCYL